MLTPEKGGKYYKYCRAINTQVAIRRVRKVLTTQTSTIYAWPKVPFSSIIFAIFCSLAHIHTNASKNEIKNNNTVSDVRFPHPGFLY